MFRNFVIIVVFIFHPVYIFSQLYAPDANWSDVTDYPEIFNSADLLCVFNASEFAGTVQGELLAYSIDSTYSWNFEWSKYNPATLNYEVILSDTGMFSELSGIVETGSYKVKMTKGSEVRNYAGWVFLHDFNVEILSKDIPGNTVPMRYYTCDFLDLSSQLTRDTLRYNIPGIDTNLILSNNYSNISWTADPPVEYSPAGILNPRIWSPPAEDTEYTITITDRFGAVRSDKVLYESIQSEAVFSEEYISLNNEDYYTNKYDTLFYNNSYNSEYHSAPMKLKYTNNSKNAVKFTWEFGDGESLYSELIDEEIVHTYLFPGEYEVKLITKSQVPFECVDSSKVIITLSPPQLNVPNVFTPNGDNKNDVFRVYDVSVIDFHIVIFNRYGRKVHEYEGDIREWKGWNGKINNSNDEAAEGTYYYVIDRAMAIKDWKDPKLVDFENPDSSSGSTQPEETKKDVYKGVIHLYRNAR
ncbi:MAG: gliding motility-associated C-terminal domain-containing protein [Bacteroidales bacterium]|nr:gliding motility-associated C-terminal domain-containing protein [Bacteroidales bacterium]